MSTVITAGNISANFNMSGDGTGILEFRTGTGTGTTALTLSAAQKTILACTALSTASNGMIEYNGTAFYGTPQGTQRGLMPSAQYFRLNAGLVGADSTSAQGIFGVSVTLTGSTVYEFEGLYLLSKTSGTTSHAVMFNFGGTATINNIGGFVDQQFASSSFDVPSLNAGNHGIAGFVNNSVVAIYTSTSATQYHTVLVKGTVSINAGGTLRPQYTLSAAPGGAYTTVAGSYFNIYPIGASGSNTSIGTWA
jgi:hypothetical protein